MKVEQAEKRKAARAAAAARRAKAAAVEGADSGGFISRLAVANRDIIREELDALLKKIDGAAKEIEHSLTFDALQKYRGLVKQFLNMIVSDLFEVQEKISVSPTGRQKSLIIVKKIDETLEDLANNFVERQKNLLAFMATLDQIRGMLLDLYS